MWILTFIFGLFVINLAYIPSLGNSLFPIDDNALVEAPQVKSKVDLPTLRTLFTVGTNVDYYPIRDLSYLADYQFFGTHWEFWHLHNLLLFNELILVICILLILFQVPIGPAVALSLLWGVHPIHAEMVGWLSARKDLLALIYFGYAVISFTLAVRKNANAWFGISTLFFILSLLSKATFSVFPGFAWVIFFLYGRKPTKRTHLWIGILVLLGLISAFFQSWFYSHVTDMRLFYPYSYRFQGSLVALAREWGGIVFNSLNIVNTDNWGSWLEENQYLVPYGALVLASLIAAFCYGLLKKKRSFLIPLIAYFLLYLPTSGLLFQHRNFYSVRYFDPAFLAFYLGAIVLFFQGSFKSERKLDLKVAALALVIFIGILPVLQAEAVLWINPVYVLQKAAYNQPNSIDLKIFFYRESIFAMRKNPNLHFETEIVRLKAELIVLCEETDRYLSSCGAFYGDRYRQALVLGEPPPYKQRDRFLKSLEMTFPDRHWSTYAAIAAALKSGEAIDPLLWKEWRNDSFYLTTSSTRALFWVSECFLKGEEAAKATLKDYYQKRLITDADATQFVLEEISPTLRLRLKSCFVKDVPQSG